MPESLPKPETSEGTHLSYAAQWFAFGVLAFIALGYAARQQARINREDKEAQEEAEARGEEAPVVHSAYRARRKPTKARRDGKLTDEEAEDRWIEENLS
jgi:membrane protein implicated in regulation of membrane protease activity